MLGGCRDKSPHSHLGKNQGYEPTAVEMASSGDEYVDRDSQRSMGRKRRRCKTAPEEHEAPPMAAMEFCHLCGQVLDADVKTFFRHKLHKGACWAAVRSYRRLICGNRALLAATDTMMNSSPEEWRVNILPLVAPDGQRSSAARRAVKQRLLVEEQRSYTNREDVEEHLIMNRRQYIKYMKNTEDLDSSDADNDFNRDLRNQAAMHSTRDESRVAVVVNKVRLVKGYSTSSAHQRISDERGPTTPTASPPRPSPGGGGGPGPRRDRRDRSRHSRRSRRRSSSRGRRRHRSRGGSSGSERGDRMASPVAPSTTGAPTARSGSGMRRPQVQEVAQEDSDGNDLGRSPENGTSRSRAAAGSGSGRREMTPVEFLDIKSRLKRRIDATLASCAGPRSMAAKIKALADKIPDEKILSLEMTPQQVLSSLEVARMEIAGLLKDLDGIKAPKIMEFKSLVDQKHDELERQRVAAKDTFDALEFIVSEASREVKGEKNRMRYVRDRARRALVRNGWGKEFAVAWLAKVKPGGEQPGDSVCDIDFRKAMYWTPVVADGDKVCAAFESAVAAGISVFNDKRAILENNLTANPDWGGALARMNDLKLDSLNGLFPSVAEVFTNDPGCSVWLLVARMYSWRFGPGAIPLPGIPALWFNRSARAEVVLTLLPMEEMLGKGICTSDLPQFLNTPTGAAYFEQVGATITMKGGEAAFTPGGLIVIATAIVDIEGKYSDEKRKQLSMDNAAIMHLPLMSKDASAGIADGILRAIAEVNETHMKKHPDSKLWSTRRDRFCQWMIDTGIAMST